MPYAEAGKMAEEHVLLMDKFIAKILDKNPTLQDPNNPGKPKNEYEKGIKIGAFLLAHKASVDFLFDNKSIAGIFGMKTVKPLNKIENTFLKLIDWELGLSTKPETEEEKLEPPKEGL